MNQEFDVSGVVHVRTNKHLAEQFKIALSRMIEDILKISESSDDSDRINKVPGVFALACMFFRIWPEKDKKMFKALSKEVLDKITPVFLLYADVVWAPAEFLVSPGNFPIELVHGSKIEPRKIKSAFAANFVKNFPQQVESLSIQASVWMARFESNLINRGDMKSVINTRIGLIRHGLALANQARNCFSTMVSVQSNITTTNVVLLCRCITLVKAIVSTFRRRAGLVAESSSLMNQALCLSIIDVINPAIAPINAELRSKQTTDELKFDVLTTANIALDMLRACSTIQRRTVLKIAFSVVSNPSFLR